MNMDKSKIVTDEYSKGNIVIFTIEGPEAINLNEFLKQPIDGILYDLNRGESTVLTFIDSSEKWVNDYAVAKVIRELKRRLDKYEKLNT